MDALPPLRRAIPTGRPATISGFKHVRDDPGFDLWSDTSTLFTRVFRGHVTLAEEDQAEVLGAGVINVHLDDFLRPAHDVRGGCREPRRAGRGPAAAFGRSFMGKLWDVYARRILDYGPI